MGHLDRTGVGPRAGVGSEHLGGAGPGDEDPTVVEPVAVCPKRGRFMGGTVVQVAAGGSSSSALARTSRCAVRR